MKSVILRTATRFLSVLLAVVAVFVLLRGHNAPGGGFIGGLLMAAALVLHALAYSVAGARRLLRVDPRTMLGVGVAMLVGSGLVGLATGGGFLEGFWTGIPLPLAGKISTILVFDLGVFLVVVGAAVAILFEVQEDAA